LDSFVGSLEHRESISVYLICKRSIDIMVSVVGLILLSPLMLMVGFGIKFFSPGPVFFKQKRVGLKSELFDIIKFRTMDEGAEEVLHSLPEFHSRVEPFVQLKNDPRVFPFGKTLRRISVDEIPQLINVLWGQMSIVGPRPLIAYEMEHCNRKQLKRVMVKPGLTGLAQISGRNDTPFDERMEMDLKYMSNSSLWLDFKIIFKTLIKVLRGEGAY